MPPVYVSEPGAQVRTKHGRLVVSLGDRPLLEVPLAQVEQLTVLGRGVQVSTAALLELVGRGVEIAYLSRGGRFLGKLVGAPNGSVRLRLAQYGWVADPTRTLRVARFVVAAKLAGQALLRRRYGLDEPGAELPRRLREVERVGTLDQLCGVEGAGAAAHFRAIRPFLPAELGFQVRAHHPPPDPVNAALSFGYTLLLNEVIGRINVVGLDPYAGFLHALEPGRPSLGLDLEEEWRPLVDELVVDLFRQRELRVTDFTREAAGIRLTPEARKRFLLAYELQLGRRLSHALAHGRVTVRHAIELQVRQVAQVLSGERDDFEVARLAEWWGG